MCFLKNTHFKIKHFFANYQSFGLLFTIFCFYLAKLHPQNAKTRQCKFISLQVHTTRAGSRLYFHPCRSNLFADASDSELRRIMAPSTAAYLRIGSPNNRGNIGVCDLLSPAQVGFVAHDFALPRARTCRTSQKWMLYRN